VKVEEQAYAKVNLVLRVGAPRRDGLHPVCSLFASIALADRVTVAPAELDGVTCAGVDGKNLAAKALRAFRASVPELPALHVTIEKRIPVAAGLGGGSADAAAVLRAANTLSGGPLAPADLRRMAAGLGSDVPSQVEPRHALVIGVGEQVEPIELPPAALVLLPQAQGLATATVYGELDRMRASAGASADAVLDPEPLRRLSGASLGELAWTLHNDLQPAAISLRPELERSLARLDAAGAVAAQVTGSGPTTFGLFERKAAARVAAERLPGAILTEIRSC
jgi:4-diphosphocytidyl-2-C-methyl-D-erythritol kinase